MEIEKQDAHTLKGFFGFYMRTIGIIIPLFFLLILIIWFSSPSVKTNYLSYAQSLLLSDSFYLFILIGFFAQMIDGALGMAYGAISNSFLMSMGIPPAVASAGIHVSEVFTTGVSGFSHWKMGNVDKQLFKKLAIPGIIGAAMGAFVLSSFDGKVIKPYVSVYLLVLGIIIFSRAFRKTIVFRKIKQIPVLAVFGGFIDASGGGGWGPVVSSTLMSTGGTPRYTIGTVNAAEFLIALTASGVFSVMIGLSLWPIILGLILGGSLAAPIGAFICHKIPARTIMLAVGILVILVSCNNIFGLI